jgi:HKD family nuclease
MKVEAIPNRGVVSMGPEIDRGLGWAREADMASAFVTNASLRLLDSALSRAREQRRSLKIRAVVGLYQRFTPPNALAALLRLRKEYPGKLSVRVARNNRFHWKLYAFRNGPARRFFVGSANLTQDGMKAEGELCVKITAAARDSISKSLEEEFERLWRDDEESVTLSGELLNKYRGVARPARRYVHPDGDNTLGRVLKPPKRLPREPSAERPAVDAKPRVSYTPYDVSDETAEIVEAETSWDKKGWGFIAYHYKGHFEREMRAGVLLLVAPHTRPREPWLRFVEVKEWAPLLETPDGKYFLAYSRVPYSRERPYDGEVRRELGRVGLSLKRIKAGAALNREQLEELCRLLHVKPEKLLRLGPR